MAPRSGGRRPGRGARLRHGLLARMLAGSVLVAVCSISATAWLSVQGASESISAERGRTLAADTRIHDALVGYAATHPEWEGVQETVDELAARTGRRIALLSESGRPIADSADQETSLPARTTSVVDPLALDVAFADDGADRIDDRAAGPFVLAEADAARLREAADAGAACLEENHAGLDPEVVVRSSGRPAIETADGTVDRWTLEDCGVLERLAPTGGEQEALNELNALIGDCLEPYGDAEVEYRIDPVTGRGAVGAFSAAAGAAPDPGLPSPDPSPAPGAGQGSAGSTGPWIPGRGGTARLTPEAAACVDSARREQLEPYVAPAALLYLSDPQAEGPGAFALSREGAVRIFGVVLLVLLLTVAVSATLSTRLVRPVRALTDAVRRMRAGDSAARVEVRDSGEVGQLAAAFNEMSEHLEQLEKQRKAMVSDVSHELRTPLSNLRGWLEAAQDGVADLDEERMGMLVEETRLLQRIIDDLQELALADAGKLRLFREPVDAGDLVEQAAARHRLRAASDGVALATDVRGDVPLVADRARLLQVIGNLVGNALRHTPAPGRVTVRARGSGGDALIEVEDTGTGIAPEDLPHVFDRFWRAEKSRSRQTGGSGLGLAIARNLVELHGGRITAAGAPGGGTVFTIRLPLDPGSAEDPRAGAPVPT